MTSRKCFLGIKTHFEMKVGSLMGFTKAADRGNDKLLRNLPGLCFSFIIPLIVFFLHPFGMTTQQSAVTAMLVLVIIWWCTGVVDKTVASCVLIVFFVFFSGAPISTVFSFPRSSSFPLIALTYLFSRGVTNSGLADKYFEPLLRKVGKTPFKILLLSAVMLVALIYAIPQPLARLIIIADILKAYLDKTDADKNTKSVLLYGVFFLYIFVNMLTMNADIILNTTSVAVAGLTMSDTGWMRYMSVPSFFYTIAALAVFCFVFRKNIRGIEIHMSENEAPKSDVHAGHKPKTVLILVILTVVLWLTEPVHKIPNWTITLGSILVMYAIGELRLKDLNAIDVKMLAFLTAAMSIGGVLSANKTADCIFSQLKALIGTGSGNYIIFAIMLITICMHMLLGSNTTTVSVVIPGIMYMCKGILPSEIVLFTVYITSVTQWLFPFHSVGLMMGASKNYFTSRQILSMGLCLSVMVFAAVFGLYLPWWRFIGA